MRVRSYRSTRYELGEVLGEGGFGDVVQARDLLLRRRVAIKRMRFRDGDKSEQMLRFLQEAQFMAQLNHPGIPPLHDVGLDNLGQPYYVMRLVRGSTLAQILTNSRGMVTPALLRSTTRTLIKICNALAYAHDKHIIHGDLSPRNVMVGRFGEVQVVDWGLARSLVANSTATGNTKGAESLKRRIDEQVRHVSHPKGSPGYLAPEAVKEPQLPMPAWDVYSDRKSTRLNSSHLGISYAVFCLKKKKITT